ncbi:MULTISPECIES: SAM hydrolase/SAM-dependent halogenase family protein [Niastella]|uniref:S-adenosyl-l-methionine hydroxide adenosyltransferase family protein n=1 Tax=Niastella soli TaxID=2821487 RepID=A0ABS3YVB9_9BACT|nr:S-adenosyl-l-methionine hydroxide adenosyltransferase family protein [Niastella soli]MBO9201774.1 S-adenosyl-l-methionine hydroxide adenosyltransferase family protein [Niastella soli]
MKKTQVLIVFTICIVTACNHQKGVVVFQTDYGLKDGAVAAMKGVATGVDPDLKLYDLTHEIPAFNIWEGAYRLQQTAPYWPTGTVFVSVVDPGVGTDRKSVVLKTKTGHYFVTPDNGTLTLIAQSLGIESVREINEELNRRKNSQASYTFHGRDVYAYTGARLAAGVIKFEQVGRELPPAVVTIPYQKAVNQGDSILGNIPILDVQYGNIWTNINDSIFKVLHVEPKEKVEVNINRNGTPVFSQDVEFVHTFGDVPAGKTLAYMNSLMNFSLAINMGNMADSFHINSGAEWNIVVKRKKPN